MSETTHHEDCWRDHPGCAYERGRADERAKLADEYRSIADDQTAMQNWLEAHGLPIVLDAAAANVTAAHAAELEHRLGGDTGRTDG